MKLSVNDKPIIQVQPLVSIIMPSYNSELTIKESIDSIIQQSYDNWELLITDDCSSDNTQQIINQYMEKDNRINLVINKVNSGAGFSRNQSILRSSGKYIAFLDSDDIWLPNKLEKQIEFMEVGNILFSYGPYQKFSNNELRGSYFPPESVTYDQLLYGCVIGCLTVIFNAEILGRQTMPLIRKRQDMGLWLQLLKLCGKAYAIQDILAFYRVDSGMSQNKLSAAIFQWQLYREVLGLNLFKSAKYFVFYAAKGFAKYLI